MITHFYADPHFGHRLIIDYAERPYATLDEMHAAFVRNYNDYVGWPDTVVWCGDAFFMGWEPARAILSSMHGKKILVIGNHDGTRSKCARMGFDLVTDELQLRIGNRHVVVSHYPYAETKRRHGDVDARYLELRPKRRRGEVLIHGHTHTSRRREGSMIHVGVDAWDYRPATFGEVAVLVAEV